MGRLLPWLERAPAWTMGFGTMACAAAEVLWFLERTDHLETIEAALRKKLLPPDFCIPMADGRHALACCCALSGRYDEAGRWFAEARLVLAEQGRRRTSPSVTSTRPSCTSGAAGRVTTPLPPRCSKPPSGSSKTIGMTGWLRRAQDLETTLSRA